MSTNINANPFVHKLYRSSCIEAHMLSKGRYR